MTTPDDFYMGDSNFCRMLHQVTGRPKEVNAGGKYYIDLAIGGQRTSSLITKVERIVRRESKWYVPDLDRRRVVLMIGTNDFLKGKTLKNFRRQFPHLLRLVKKLPARDFLVVTLPPCKGDPSIDDFNNLIVDTCRKMGVRCLDLREKWVPTMLDRDRIHLNSSGYDFLYRSIRRETE